MARLKTAIEKFRIGGLSGIRTAAKYGVFYRGTFVRWRMEAPLSAPILESSPELRIRKISAEELERYRTSLARPLPSEFYIDRTHGITHCYVALWNSKLAHVSWVFGFHDHPPYIKLEEDQVEIRHVYTLPEYRGKRIFSKVLVEILKDLGEQKVSVVFGQTATTNRGSLRAFEAAGFRPVGTMELTITLGFRHIRYLDGVVPPIPPSQSMDSPPTI